jgi:hypothetical protein
MNGAQHENTSTKDERWGVIRMYLSTPCSLVSRGRRERHDVAPHRISSSRSSQRSIEVLLYGTVVGLTSIKKHFFVRQKATMLLPPRPTADRKTYGRETKDRTQSKISYCMPLPYSSSTMAWRKVVRCLNRFIHFRFIQPY